MRAWIRTWVSLTPGPASFLGYLAPWVSPQVSPGRGGEAWRLTRTLVPKKSGLGQTSSSSLLPGEVVKGHFMTFQEVHQKKWPSLNATEVWVFSAMKSGGASTLPPSLQPCSSLFFFPQHFPPSNMSSAVPAPQSDLPPPPPPPGWNPSRDLARLVRGQEKCLAHSRAPPASINLLMMNA